ncbi:MAG: EAL domain-containing protein [Gammaproteobacteria bacterium]|nr:EAL domain-containing protein [Gammaproteobacteria bacterium]MDH5240352.1 EAL domain-containing protein [Gammaproteobacteria bacterium]MDH5261982.1 EAL domain-containing protein [Gammaproteobacteria bacterium]MDH5583878.1 EAL domain-containing protein [Gammaproteobacteria bacterium]
MSGAVNRILVVDDDAMLISEYIRCLGEDFEPDLGATTLTDLEKVLFGDDTDERGAVKFEVHTRNQGEAAVEAVAAAVEAGQPYSIVFVDIRMPPGIDGIEAAKRIRMLDPNVNIVVVTGSVSPAPESLGKQIPPADKVFFFQKPFHALECRQLAAALCGKWHADRALRRANEDLERRVEERTTALQKLAYFDVVTRLPNQLLLIEELKKLIERAEDTEGDTVVVLIDINRFSFINETMGYDSGTELLRSIANRLSRTFCDDQGHRMAVVGRFGADEFAILAPGIQNDSEIRELAELVRETVEAPFLINGRDLFLKASIGVSWHPVHGRDAKSVFRCAEAALHRSMNGLNTSITYYHSEMRYRARYKFDLEVELRGAIEQGHITAHYQPQQCTKTGNLAGVEALARWTRPDGSLVPPSDFIPLSEEMGISDVLFESIMRCVCADVANWRRRGDWKVPVSVNLSAHQLRNRDLVSLIKGILSSEDIDRKLINLELTETVLLEDLTVAQPLLDDLAAFGVGIHIDDFGTGYSSLSYLAQLPVQTIKIDQAFVRQLSDSDANNRVVEAIIALGKAMQLVVVAEGVETDQQYAIVRRLGCDLVQGYFIARPMSADQLMTWVDGYEDTQSIKKRSLVADFDSKR